MKKILLLCVALSFLMFGCGSETDGILTLNDITVKDLTGGNYTVESSAIFVSSKTIANTKITYTATFKINGTLIDSRSADLYSDNTGKVVIGPWQVTQNAAPIIVTITATTGDLTATKTTSIPAATAVP